MLFSYRGLKTGGCKILNLYSINYERSNDLPKISDITKSATKTKNSILAIDAAPAAIPPKPKIAATIATIKKVTDQRNIISNFE